MAHFWAFCTNYGISKLLIYQFRVPSRTLNQNKSRIKLRKSMEARYNPPSFLTGICKRTFLRGILSKTPWTFSSLQVYWYLYHPVGPLIRMDRSQIFLLDQNPTFFHSNLHSLINWSTVPVQMKFWREICCIRCFDWIKFSRGMKHMAHCTQ